MAIGKKKGAIVSKGGGVLQVIEVNADGTSKGLAWTDLGFVDKTRVQDSTDTKEIPDERGVVVASEDQTRSAKLTSELMQTDAELISFLKETIRGKFYAIYYNSGKVDGKTQEIFCGICRIKPQVDLASGTKRIPFEATILQNDNTVTFGAGGITLPSGVVATTPSIQANELYTVLDN